MTRLEVWRLVDGSFVGLGHCPERRRHLRSPDDALIAVYMFEPNVSVSDLVHRAATEFKKGSEVIDHASRLLCDEYSNGVQVGDRIELIKEIEHLDMPIPIGTCLRVVQGDADFPEFLYADTFKWPKGSGRDSHFEMVLLKTEELGLSYRVHGESRMLR